MALEPADLLGDGAEYGKIAGLKPRHVLSGGMGGHAFGFDVVERLRGNDSTRALPIIVLTAKDLTEADKAQLNGRVSRILTRRSTGAADLLSQLQEVLVHRGVPA